MNSPASKNFARADLFVGVGFTNFGSGRCDYLVSYFLFLFFFVRFFFFFFYLIVVSIIGNTVGESDLLD